MAFYISDENGNLIKYAGLGNGGSIDPSLLDNLVKIDDVQSKQLYARNNQGVVTGISYDVNPTENSFPTRGVGAVLKVGTPQSDEDAATKAYVDGVINSINEFNPNLLINGDFRVNQRGLTIYKSQTNANIYSLDHWQIGTNAIGVTVATKSGEATNYGGGIILSCTSNVPSSYNILRQYIEDYEILQGKTLTLSCYVSNFSGSLNLRIFGTNLIKSQALQSGLNIMSVTIPSNITRLYFAISCLGVESSATIEWVKLEIGSVATPFSPRPYAEELALCQRYYQVLGIDSVAYSTYGAVSYENEEYYGVNTSIPLISIMRTTPTIKIISMPYIRNYNNLNVRAFRMNQIILFRNNEIQLQFLANGAESGVIYATFNGSVSLDAEIY